MTLFVQFGYSLSLLGEREVERGEERVEETN